MNKFQILQKLHVSQEQKNRVETVVLDCILMAQKRYGVEQIKVIPEVRYNTKGVAAGICGYNRFTGEHWIEINPVLLNENEGEILKQTVPHEVAHCVINQLYPNGRKRVSNTGMFFGNIEPHGYEWSQVMVLFGVEPRRCHAMDVSTIKAIRNGGVEHHYKCGCTLHKLSKIKHTRQQNNGGNYYTCRRCGGKLVFDKTVSVC